MNPARTLLFIPCKAMPASKSRLAGLLRVEDRSALAAALYVRTLRTAVRVQPPGALAVISPDTQVLAWAEELGADGVWDATCDDLNRVADRMRAVAVDRGFESFAYVPIDLPRLTPADLVDLLAGRPGELTLVPDRSRGGTNGMVIPVDSPFRSKLGPGSFARHLDQARALGIAPRLPVLDSMAFDIDTAQDFRDFVRYDLLPSDPLAVPAGRDA
jgi:2-phospho-L-lactate guanylyltransferase